MRNEECTIIIKSNEGKTYQTIRKQNNTWIQTVTSNGNTHTMTAEQLLSHILPALAYGHATIKVIPNKNAKKPKHNPTHKKNPEITSNLQQTTNHATRKHQSSI
jgi:hypothetical protein